MNEILAKIRALLGLVEEETAKALNDVAAGNHAALLAGVSAKTVDMAGDAPVEGGQDAKAEIPMEGMPVEGEPMTEPEHEPEPEEEAVAARVGALEAAVAELQAVVSALASRATAVEATSAELRGAVEAVTTDVQARATSDEVATTVVAIDRLNSSLRAMTDAAVAVKSAAQQVKESPQMAQVKVDERMADQQVGTGAFVKFVAR